MNWDAGKMLDCGKGETGPRTMNNLLPSNVRKVTLIKNIRHF